MADPEQEEIAKAQRSLAQKDIEKTVADAPKKEDKKVSELEKKAEETKVEEVRKPFLPISETSRVETYKTWNIFADEGCVEHFVIDWNNLEDVYSRDYELFTFNIRRTFSMAQDFVIDKPF